MAALQFLERVHDAHPAETASLLPVAAPAAEVTSRSFGPSLPKALQVVLALGLASAIWAGAGRAHSPSLRAGWLNAIQTKQGYAEQGEQDYTQQALADSYYASESDLGDGVQEQGGDAYGGQQSDDFVYEDTGSTDAQASYSGESRDAADPFAFASPDAQDDPYAASTSSGDDYGEVVTSGEGSGEQDGYGYGEDVGYGYGYGDDTYGQATSDGDQSNVVSENGYGGSSDLGSYGDSQSMGAGSQSSGSNVETSVYGGAGISSSSSGDSGTSGGGDMYGQSPGASGEYSSEATASGLGYGDQLITTIITTTSAPKVSSLFCFAVMKSDTYEVGLLKQLLEKGISVFACDVWSVFSDKEVELTPGPPVRLQSVSIGSMDCEYGGEFGLALNTDVFVKVWRKVFEEKKYLRYSWSVKVDPDCVFLPDRLRKQTEKSDGMANVYLNNCDQGLHGPIEVLAQGGMETFRKGIDKCLDDQHIKEEKTKWGEDVFLRHCLGVLKVDRVDNFRLLSEKACFYENPNENGCKSGKASFHPFKEADQYMKCYDEAKSHPSDTGKS